MTLIKELLDLHNTKQPVSEHFGRGRSGYVFDEMEEIKIDPDRDDPHDIAFKLAPAILKMAYVYLLEDKDKHSRNNEDRDPEDKDPDFDFSKDALIEKAAELAEDIAGKLKDIDKDYWSVHLNAVERHFKHKLTQRKS